MDRAVTACDYLQCFHLTPSSTRTACVFQRRLTLRNTHWRTLWQVCRAWADVQNALAEYDLFVSA